MEIRNVVNETKNMYPKMEQIDQKHILNNIPKKWMRFSLLYAVIEITTKSKAIAVETDIVGGMSAVPVEYRVINMNVFILLVTSIITGVFWGITSIISKKQPKIKKVRKWLKKIFIILLILTILFCAVRYFYGNY